MRKTLLAVFCILMFSFGYWACLPRPAKCSGLTCDNIGCSNSGDCGPACRCFVSLCYRRN